MTAELSDDDRGKSVINGTERIGTVTDVRGGTAYVGFVGPEGGRHHGHLIVWVEHSSAYEAYELSSDTEEPVAVH
jgi:hypothetical protein